MKEKEMGSNNWKTIRGFKKYECSKNGFIRNRKTKRILKTSRDTHGYERVTLHRKQKLKTFLVHRIILKTFEPIKTQFKKEVNHINRIRYDNRLKNLEWTTKKQNLRHARKERKLYGKVHQLTQKEEKQIKKLLGWKKVNIKNLCLCFNVNENQIWRIEAMQRLDKAYARSLKRLSKAS